MEFTKGLKENISDWWNNRKCDSDKLGTRNVMVIHFAPYYKGSGTKDDPIDLTEDTDKEDNDLDDVDSGSESDDDSDGDRDSEVEHYCCNGENCDNEGEFEDLQEAYDNG